MTWANIRTKVAERLTALGYTESKVRIDFDEAPAVGAHKSFFIVANLLEEPREADDVRDFEHRKLNLYIFILYRMELNKEKELYDSIPTDWETIANDLVNPVNMPSLAILADFENARVRRLADDQRHYLLSELRFTYLYKLSL